MKAFADLYGRIDRTTKTTGKVAAMVDFLRAVQPAEAAWALFFLSGRKVRRAVTMPSLRRWAVERADIPAWLFDESYDAVGDLAETIALLLPPSGRSSERSLDEWVHEELLPLPDAEESERKRRVVAAWGRMSPEQTFVWNKLLTGAFRVGVSQLLVTRALAKVSGLPAATIAHRLMGPWSPTAEFYQALIAPNELASDVSRPYPFFLAHPLEAAPESLGAVGEWHVEWKWDGIRCQAIRRSGQTFLWSRGEELITERFPEVAATCDRLPEGTVLDGEILPWRECRSLPFGELQRRITRKTVTKRLLAEVPVALIAFDVLEWEGHDCRGDSFAERRGRLECLIAERFAGTNLIVSPAVEAASWAELAALRAESRSRAVEGLMLKRRTSPYGTGRTRGDWWKWKIEPHTVDAVLIYAQRGSGKRASLYTDYTFGVWDQGQLVPIAKAYSGLTDEEIRHVDAFVRRNTTEKFGPVRTVKPELVFELGFENIQASTRHRSGVAVRFPRILRQRFDKKIEDADTLDRVRAMIPTHRQTAEVRRKRDAEEGLTLFDLAEGEAPGADSDDG
jgi:DNA ligase-1